MYARSTRKKTEARAKSDYDAIPRPDGNATWSEGGARLYVGSLEIAKYLARNRIPALAVNACVTILGGEFKGPRFFAQKRFAHGPIRHYRFFARDEPDDILPLWRAVQVIQRSLTVPGSTHGVFVHCMSGMSRSVSLVAAFIVWRCRIDDEQALAHIQQYRKIANPNSGFRRQLKRFATAIREFAIVFSAIDAALSIALDYYDYDEPLDLL
jgi:hypothetical protein